MQELHNTAVFLVRGADSTVIGTGFVIHRDHQGVYLLTCEHVVARTGPNPLVEASASLQSAVIATGREVGIDLAILHIAVPTPTTSLPLAEAGATGTAVTLHGYKRHADNHQILYRPIEARLGAPIRLQERRDAPWVHGWDVTMVGGFKLADGYSGAPAVDDRGQVIGVAAIREDGGMKGQIITIGSLRDCWPALPPDLIVTTGPQPQRPKALDNQQIIRGIYLLVQSTYCQTQQRLLGLFEDQELKHLQPIVPSPESGSQHERAEALIIELNRRRLRDGCPALPYLFQVVAARIEAVDAVLSKDLAAFGKELTPS